MIVVKALTHSPWGTYTVAFTIPLAILWASTCVICVRAHRRGVGHWAGIPYFRYYFRRMGGGKPNSGAVL